MSTPPTGSTTGRHYEIVVAGEIGPVLASTLSGFTTTTVPTVTVLAVAVPDREKLRVILALLHARGLAATEGQNWVVA
jgi:hypothetical protein